MRRSFLAVTALALTLQLGASAGAPRREDLTVTVFLTTDATEQQVRAVEARLNGVPDSIGLTHHTPEEMYRRMREMFADRPELVADVEPGAIPGSFTMNLADRPAFERAHRGPLRGDLRGMDGVDSVVFRGKPSQASVDECVVDLRVAPSPPVHLDIEVFLTNGAAVAERRAVEERLRAIPGAAGLRLRDRAEAYERFTELFGDVRPELVASAKPEDLPESLVLTLADEQSALRATRARVDEDICRLPGVDRVHVPPLPLAVD